MIPFPKGYLQRLAGVVATACRITSDLILGASLAQIASGHSLQWGLGGMVAFIALRLSAELIIDTVTSRGAHALRTRAWAINNERRRSLTHLRGSEAQWFARDLSELSSLRVTDSITLTMLAASVLVVWYGGAWCALILGALFIGSVVLYIITGRRSAVYMERQREIALTLEARLRRVVRHIPELKGVSSGEPLRLTEAISREQSRRDDEALRATSGSSFVTDFATGVGIGLVAMVCGFAILKGSSLSHGLIAVLVTVDLATSLRTWSASFHRRSNARTWITWANTPAPETPLPASSALIEATNLDTLAPMAPLSLRVNVADHVLIRGASGVGKSTLLDALLGVGNAVVLEGQVARRVVRSALIRPDSPLRQGTIDDNLSLGRALDPHDLEFMLRRVGLWPSRISSANDAVASDGRNFSDGERIRLLIAQALLNDVELLVLDDVASSLDTESRTRLRNLFDTQDSLTIIEATSDDPLAQPTITVDLEWAR